MATISSSREFKQWSVEQALKPEVRAELIAVQPAMDRSNVLEAALYLAKWFKSKMTWLPEVPTCKTCKVTMQMSIYKFDTMFQFAPDSTHWTGHKRTPTNAESTCFKIERYLCLKCRHVEVVSRENDVRVLLKTWRGRCGETAILFVALCLAAGWRSRLVLFEDDDHVIVEVFDNGQWNPIDPSVVDSDRLLKNIYLYQSWGWHLKQVIAFEPGKKPVNVANRYKK